MKNGKLFLLILGLFLGIGVISGGTYALLSFNATLQNTTKNITSKNFKFSSPTGTAVTNLYPFPSQPVRSAITSGNGYVVLTLNKAINTSLASSVKILVKFDTMEVNVDDYIKVAVCRSSTANDCNNSQDTEIPSSTNNTDWVVVNKSIQNNTLEQVLWEDTAATNSPFAVIGSASSTYYIYFWLNAEVVTNDNASVLANSHVSGSVYFITTQGSN